MSLLRPQSSVQGLFGSTGEYRNSLVLQRASADSFSCSSTNGFSGFK
jgi:hypothetical protein